MRWGRWGIGLIFVGGAMLLLWQKPGQGGSRKIWIEGDAWETAQSLSSRGIIGNPVAFYFLALRKGIKDVSGEYRLSSEMDYGSILEKLQRGEVVEYRVTFPEGFTALQMGRRLQKLHIVGKEKFLGEVQAPSFSLKSFPHVPSSGSLEGYLFPETYFFARDVRADLVVERFLAQFEKVWTEEVEPSVQVTGYRVPDFVIIASLIEKEARLDRERPLIASVIYNRLRRNMPLQIDATVQYLFKKHKSRILFRDLEIDSPYNTYRRRGLPPGPICNPGLKSLLAAVAPSSSPYLYYVARTDGSHLFASTLQEHIFNRRRVQVNSRG